MNEQLDLAPCGYLTMTKEGRILEMNRWVRSLYVGRKIPEHIHELLSIPSRVFFRPTLLRRLRCTVMSKKCI